MDVYFAGFYANETIARRHKQSGILDNFFGVGPDEENGQPLTKDFINAGVAVRRGEYFVAFGEISAMVEQLDLFVCRQCDWNRFIHFIPPNPFGAVCDKSPVTVVALLQLFFGILALGNVGRGADDFPHTAVCISRKDLVATVKPAPRAI